MDIPSFFSDKENILNFDYSTIGKYIGSEIDHSTYINNLSPSNDKLNLVTQYFKSILQGYNHVFISKILKDLNNPNSNLCLPLLNKWNDELSIDNLVIINHPDDSEKIAKRHVKKAPIFKSLLNDSIISTTDNKDWQNQRNNMNPAFLPNLSLKDIFHDSLKRSMISTEILIKMSCDYKEPVNMSDFFLNETQAQLQKAMFGFSNEFESKTNKRIRDVFSGINI